MKRVLAVAIAILLLPAAAPCQSLRLETKFNSAKSSEAMKELTGSCWLCIKDGSCQVFFQTSVNVAGGSTTHPFYIPPSGISGVWVQCPKKGGRMLTDWLSGDFTYHRRVTLAAHRLTTFYCTVGFAGTPYFLWIPIGQSAVRLS
jgi:hypothetical protein